MIARALAGRDILCFANDWDGDPLSKKHLMRRLARHNRVLWIESLGNRRPHADVHDARRVLSKLRRFTHGLRQVEPNLWVLTPVALPLYGSAWAARLNALALRATIRAAMWRLGFRRPIAYSFVPASAWVAGRLGETRVIYHCVDEYGAFAGAGADIVALEDELLRRADLTIVCSQPLLEKKRGRSARTVLVRHGVDHAHFARALDPSTVVPPELDRLPRPVIGFHGLVAEWIDLSLLRRVAEAFPSGSLVLLGEWRVPPGPLAGMPNVHIFGRRPYEELPAWCRGFDVALLPFTIDELTVHASPLKLREDLAAGLPVVATAIPEARILPGVRVADDAEGFVRAVREALADRPGPRRERSDAVAGESWDRAVERIAALVASLDP